MAGVKKIFCFFAALFSIVLISSCSKKESLKTAAPKVLVSVAPYQYFVKRIAGDTVDVTCLVPKGTNPHLYETPPNLVEKALQASIWFRLEEPGEKKFFDLFKARSKSMKVVSLSKDLNLIEDPSGCCHGHNRDAQDLHIWMSPQLVEQQASVIFTELCALFPQNTQFYEKRFKDFCNDLHSLDDEIRSIFSSHPIEAIMISHPSLGYFCRDYAIQQLSIEIEGKEPLPSSLIKLLEEAKSKNIRKILLQPQHETRGAERIAKELGLPLETIDPYSDDYFSSMRQIARVIAS